MGEICGTLHRWFNELEVLSFPFAAGAIPRNGIYVLFEDGEVAHGTRRIVRIGTHTGVNQLRSRLRQHFIKENKDRSIFRKNIGRCLLNRDNDPFLESWEVDLTTREARETYAGCIDLDRQKEIERNVSDYMQRSFSFATLEVAGKERRLGLESKIISTVSQCDQCQPSPGWFGRFSTKERIRQSGLWQVNKLYGEPLSWDELRELRGCTLRL